MGKLTFEEFRQWALDQAPDVYDDLFMQSDLRAPPGTRVPRDEATLQRWLDTAWEGGKD